MSVNLVQQQQQHPDDMVPSIFSQHNEFGQQNHSNDEYPVMSHHHPLEPSNNSIGLSYASSIVRQQSQQPQQATHHYNDQDQYPSFEEFDAIVQDYLQNLSSKKRDKALIDQARYGMILQVLKDPRNTAVSTAQFRFWVKKMFQLTSRQVVCHDGKPVAMREQIYGILVRAHREAHHGGRDKTSALVRRRYSWIPKELIARFVRHCPFCISRRNGSQQSPLSLGIFLPATPPTYSMVPTSSTITDDEGTRQRAPSMVTSSSSASSSSASYPEEMMMMAAAAAHHHQQQLKENPYGGSNASMNLSWQHGSNYYPNTATIATGNSSFFNECHTSGPESNSYKNGYNNGTKQHHYPMTYSSSNNSHMEGQTMMMQPPLSVYYAQEYGLKQNPSYPLIEGNNSSYVPPTSRSNSVFYTSNTNSTTTPVNAATVKQKVTPSPSLSPSSSSTSTTSSPVHPTYRDNNSNSTDSNTNFSQRQQNSMNGSTLNLLSHHQSLF